MVHDIYKRIDAQVVVASYEFWHTRRWILVGTVSVLFLLAGWYCLTLSYSHDIQSMLPDNDSGFREDFELFSYAPFSKNILISLEQSDGAIFDGRLEDTADRITQSLKPPYFQQAICGLPQEQKIGLFLWLHDHLPSLVNDLDIENIQDKIEPAAIEKQLQADIRSLHSPESIVLKDFILKDPLAFNGLLLGKLKRLNFASDISTESDYFLSKDGRHLLIIAETPIAITDFKGGKALLDNLYQILNKNIPEGIKYTVICGHRYTVANAETIQSDIKRVLVFSLAAQIVLFIIFLPHWRAIIVCMVPTAAFLMGIAVTGLFFERVSAITIGFGGVLLGISDDYGLHIFYGLQEKNRTIRQVLAEATRPLLFCAVTTIGVFSILLLSALPGQRQLAVFSITGIFTAFLLSLFVMPHLMPAAPVLKLKRLLLPRARKLALIIWIVLLGVSLIPAIRVEFDGNLRSIGMIPQEILKDEMVIKKIWQTVRDQALVFATGDTVETALQRNETFYEIMKSKNPDTSFSSLAPLIPSVKTQQANLARWQVFWDDSRRKAEFTKDLQEIGRHCGFGTDAFGPFLSWLDRTPATFTLDDFMQHGNDKMVLPFTAALNNGLYSVLTFIPDEDSILASLQEPGEGIRIVSNRLFSRQLNQETVRDFCWFFGGATAIIVILLLALFRDFKKALLAFSPVLAGLVIMAAMMRLFGMKINLFNVAASTLVIGLAVDYGIFVISYSDQDTDNASRNAMLVSGLTTLTGIGSLILAHHPSMYSIGITVTTGVSVSLLFALTFLPHFKHLLLKGNEI